MSARLARIPPLGVSGFAVLTVAFVWSMWWTVLRGFRWPNDWAEAQWLLDYRFGFVKRGLAGSAASALGLFDDPVAAEARIATLGLLLLVSFCAACAWIVMRSVRRAGGSITVALFGLAFACSPFVIMSGHLTGYLDHAQQILAIGSVWLALCRRPLLGASLQVVALLVHENSLIIGYPVFALALLMLFEARELTKARLGLALTMPLVAFVAVAAAQWLTDAHELVAQLEQRIRRYDFVGAGRAYLLPEAMTHRFSAYLREQSPMLLDRLTRVDCIVGVLPIVLFAWFGVVRVRISRFRIPVRVLAAATIVVPLALHVVAWDTGRIWSFTLFHVLLVVWLAVEWRTDPVDSSRLALLAFVPILTVNTLAPAPLMDDAREGITRAESALAHLPVLLIVIALAAGFRRTAVAIASALCALVLAELALRASGWRPFTRVEIDASEPLVHDPDPELGWRNRPGRYEIAAYASGAEPIDIHVLADGSRATTSSPRAAPSDGARVVFVGGSFTYGWALSDDQTLPWLAQASYPQLRVANFASVGFGTLQSLVVLERLFAGADPPDIAVYGFIAHHEDRNIAPPYWVAGLAAFSRRHDAAVPYASIDAHDALVRHAPVEYPRWPFCERSALVTQLQELPLRAASTGRSGQRRVVTERLLEEMDELCRRNGALLVVALLSGRSDVMSHYHEFLSTRKIRVVDCAVEIGPDDVVPGEVHPNAEVQRRWWARLRAAIGTELDAQSMR